MSQNKAKATGGGIKWEIGLVNNIKQQDQQLPPPPCQGIVLGRNPQQSKGSQGSIFVLISLPGKVSSLLAVTRLGFNLPEVDVFTPEDNLELIPRF